MVDDMKSLKGIMLIFMGVAVLSLVTMAVIADESGNESIETKTTSIYESTDDLLIAPAPDEGINQNVTESESADVTREPVEDEPFVISQETNDEDTLISPLPTSYTTNKGTTPKSSAVTFPPLMIGLFIAFLIILSIMGKRKSYE